MDLKEGALADIRYSKTGTGEVTDRIIIPTTVPKNIKGLDVTGMPIEQRKHLETQYAAYREYLRNHMSTAFDFESFMEHSGTTDEDIEIKWRTFKPDQTEVL